MEQPQPVAVVTGAAGGIGHAVCSVLRGHGFSVVALDILTDPGDVEADRYLCLDASDPGALTSCLGALDRIDALVCCAATMKTGPLLEMTSADWRRTLEVNVTGPFEALRAGAHALAAAGGAVVFVSSVHAIATSSGAAAYATSKAGLVGLARAAALELAPLGIRVNALLPGATETPMLNSGLSRAGDGARERLIASTPLQRIAAPEEIALAAAFLLDPRAAGFMTGQTLVLDGGALAQLSTE